jgi:hypothetical protein
LTESQSAGQSSSQAPAAAAAAPAIETEDIFGHLDPVPIKYLCERNPALGEHSLVIGDHPFDELVVGLVEWLTTSVVA